IQGRQGGRSDRRRGSEGEAGRVPPQAHLVFLRRSGGGVLGHFLKPEYEELIAHKDWESLRVAFEDLHPADIAEVLDDLPPEDSGVIFRILPRDVAGVAFEYLPIDQQAELVKTLGSEQLVNVLNGMSPDDRTRLFEELP